jgi:hypothetical protein
MVLAALAVGGCGGSSTTANTAPPLTTSTTSQSLRLPVVDIAGTAACQADMKVIELAEEAYVTLNGEYAPLDELVEGQLLRAASVYYREVKLGTPAGGYTLIGVPGKCGNVPVAGD